MKTRYSIQYWFLDEHDCLGDDFDTLEQAVSYASSLDLSKYKDILIYARHWTKINEPFEYNNITYDDWKWELIDDNFIEYFDSKGLKSKHLKN